MHRHATAPTMFVEASGVRFAYRRFGKESGTPLLFMQHFRGGMDHWDPTVTDGFAETRPVILFDNAGVAASSGETPDRIDTMALHAADFVRALGVQRFDRTRILDRRLHRADFLLTAHRTRAPSHLGRHRPTRRRAADRSEIRPVRWDDRSQDGGGAPLEAFQNLFFSPSDASQAACRAFWARRHMRAENVDPPSSPQTAAAQRAAITEWRQRRARRALCGAQAHSPTDACGERSS